MFFIPPVELREDHDKDTLAHALGATLYMPGTANRAIDKVINNEIPGLTSTVLCLEDAVAIGKLKMQRKTFALQLGTLLALAEKESSLHLIFISGYHYERISK